MEQDDKHYFPALTGIRAVAAWLVFVHHFNFFKEAVFGRPVYLFFSEMHIGVTIFFVLSGLLITLRYDDAPISSGAAFYNYLLKRFARIFPAFFLILSVNFIWLLATRIYSNSFSGGWQYYAGSVTLIRGFFANFAAPLVPQSWSLTAEECFYFSCPFIYLLLRKNFRAIYFLPIPLIATGLCITAIFAAHPFHGFFANYRFLFNFTFFGRCIEFFAGIAVALLYKKIKPLKSIAAKYTFTGAAVIFACVCVLAFFHRGSFYGDHHPLGIITNNVVLPLAGISLFFWGLLTENNFLSRFLSAAPMVLFGKSSYIFYLVHLGVFSVVFFNGVTHNPILMFAYLNIISVLLYISFERPVNLFLRKKFLRREAISFSKMEEQTYPGAE